MRFLFAVLAGAVLSAQSTDLFSKAPPDVDAALRAKVNEFYGLHTQSKFRAAEKLVCEDSKDAYFDSMKRTYTSFEIIRVNYQPGFQSASVVTKLEGDFLTGRANMVSFMPMTSFWKVEGGSWCYHIPPTPKEVRTPFGVSKGSGGGADPAALGTAAALAADPKGVLAQIQQQVKVSRSEMKLKSHEPSSDEIEIQNGTAGPLELSVSSHEYAGLKISLLPKTVPPGQRGVVRLEYQPKDTTPKDSYSFTLSIQPVNRQMRIRVYFDLPDELKKALPKDAIRH